jgi:hypothetical protein
MEVAHALVRLGPFAASLWLHTANEVPKSEWDAPIARLLEFSREHPRDVASLRTLVLSDGGAPNAAQRAQVKNELLRGRGSKMSVITTALSNPVRRGLATAVQWMNPSTRFFLPRETSQALAHVDLERWPGEIADQFAALARLLPPNGTYAATALALGVERERLADRARS